MSAEEKIKKIIDRMRFFAAHIPSGAAPKTIRKWAKEIEESLKESK